MDDLSAAAETWRAAQAQADAARAALIESVRAAALSGVSEYAIAKEVGVQRLTVRSWLGKGKG